jgi:hypothetical protein
MAVVATASGGTERITGVMATSTSSPITQSRD